jgi:hypothetical protein
VTRARPDAVNEPEGEAEAAEPETPETHDGPITNGNEVEDHMQDDMATPTRRTYGDGARTPENPASPSRPGEAASLQPSREPSPAQLNPQSVDAESVDAADGDLPVVTPKLSRKRPRTHDEYMLGPEITDAQTEDSAIQSPAGDLQIRRKRIRH